MRHGIIVGAAWRTGWSDFLVVEAAGAGLSLCFPDMTYRSSFADGSESLAYDIGELCELCELCKPEIVRQDRQNPTKRGVVRQLCELCELCNCFLIDEGGILNSFLFR